CDGSPLAESAGRAACSKTADLIVIGTHGRPGLAKRLPGSVASRVARGRPLFCSLPSVARVDPRPLTLQWRLPMKRMAWTATVVALAALVLGPAHAQLGRPGGGLSPDDERMQQMMKMMHDVQEQMRVCRDACRGCRAWAPCTAGWAR